MKPQLRILQVASAMPYWAGTEKYIIDLSYELLRLGHQAIIGCQTGSAIDSRAKALDIPTIPLEMHGTHDWWRLPTFLRAIRKRFDIVHIHHNKDYIVPAAAARLAGAPAVVMTRHLPHRFSNRLKAYVCGEMFYDGIIAVSQAVKKTLLDCGIGDKRIRVVRNGIDLSQAQNLHGAQVRASLNLPPGAFLVAAAGRLEGTKGFHVLIKAVETARRHGTPIFAVIAGQGTQEGELRKLCHELGLNEAVRFLGFRTDVLDVLSAGDVVAVPSIWADPSPYAVLEAMACAKPVVASRVGGIPEMVTDDSAMLVPAGDPEELARALGHLAQDPTRRAEMGKEALLAVQRFTIPALATNVEAVYWELIHRRATWPRGSFARAGDSEVLPHA